MSRWLSFSISAALVSVCLAGPAWAETERLAVVIGNNAGQADMTPLRYAEEDAGKVARVLVELGGVDESHLQLLQGRSLAEVRAALERAHQQVDAWHRRADTRVIVLLYFSGHSDGEALELGAERLSFSELRKALNDTGAEVKLAVVDSCKSGALLAAKGGTLGPAFQIRLADDLASTGEATLTSSAADELALESREIRGSYFTHHFVSGLRGAADASGDGRVTLAEAYRYAFDHTVSATAHAEVGPQHPAYDYHLSGEGELVLTDLSRPSALLELPEGFERALVVQLSRDQVMAELATGANRKVAVEPGGYAVQAWKQGQLHQRRLTLASGEHRTLAWADLALNPVGATSTAAKGGTTISTNATNAANAASNPAAAASVNTHPALSSSSPGPELLVGVGAQAGIANGLGAMPSFKLSLRSFGSGPQISTQIGTWRGVGFQEATALAWGGYRWGWEPKPVGVFVGLSVGGGVAVQVVDGGTVNSSLLGVAVPEAGITFRLSRSWLVTLEGSVPVAILGKDNKPAVQALPSGWACVALIF